MKILRAKSGLPVLFRPMKSGLVDIRYFVRCGAMDETRPTEEGLCHALEHMLYSGTKNRDWMEMNRSLERLGSWFNAYTYHDRTIYQITCLKRNWQEAYEVLADMMYNPTFPEERWEEVEKGAVISEMQAAEDDPDFLLAEGIYRDGLGKRYHPVLGNIPNIRQATISDLKSFYDRYYCGNNMLLTVTGDLTETQVLKAVNKHDQLRPQRPPKKEKLSFKFNYKPFAIKKQELEQSTIQLLKPLPLPRTIQGKLGLTLATSCLTQYLFEELRERRGLCYGAKAELYWDIPGNLFLTVETSTDEERFGKTKKALRKSLNSFIKDGLTTERIRNNKMSEIYSTVNSRERIERSSDWLWDAWEEGIKKDPFEYQLKALETLNHGTVRRAALQTINGRAKFGKITEKQ